MDKIEKLKQQLAAASRHLYDLQDLIDFQRGRIVEIIEDNDTLRENLKMLEKSSSFNVTDALTAINTDEDMDGDTN